MARVSAPGSLRLAALLSGLVAGLASTAMRAHADPPPPRASGLVAVTPARPGEPAAAAFAWVHYMHHVHTTEGEWQYPAGEAASADAGIEAEPYALMARRLQAIGVDAIGVTEHNTIAHAPLLLGQQRGGARPHYLIGTEYSAERGGHLGILFPPGGSPPPAIRPVDTSEVGAAEIAAAIVEARGAGALTIVNHPFLPFFPWPSESVLGADAIEIDSPAALLVSLDRNVAWWQACIVRERRPIVGLAGADYHDMPLLRPGLMRTWTNRVRVRGEASPESIFAALAAGHVQLVRPLPGTRPDEVPEVLVGADLDGDGQFDDASCGDVVRARPGSRVRLQARVIGARCHKLRVYDESSAERPVASLRVREADEAFAFERTVPERGALGLVRLELRTPLGRRLLLTNPLYVTAREPHAASR